MNDVIYVKPSKQHLEHNKCRVLAFIAAAVVIIAFIIVTNSYKQRFLEPPVNGNLPHLPLLKEHTLPE